MHEKEIRTVIADIQAAAKESEWVEFKTNNYRSETIGEYISALANGAAYMGQSKGYLAFGIDDATHAIVGTTYNPKNDKIGDQEIENWIATQLSPRIDFVIEETIINGKHVVLFIIDAAGNTPVKFKGTAWIRVGTYKKKLSEHPERERKIWQNTYNNCFENRIALSGISPDEVLAVIDYPSAFQLLHIPLPENKIGILEKLTEEKIINKRGASYDVTNLGAILFASDLKHFSPLSRKAVRIIFYKDNSRINAIKEQTVEKGYAVGFKNMVDYVNANLPVNEQIGEALRVDTPMYPSVAIREFVANALIHQDFSIGGTSPMIEIFKSRMELTNPGKPLIDTLRFIDHSPVSRNEQLAAIMRRMNFCEERGSGIDRAIKACELHQLPAPDFQKDDDFTRVIMFAPKPMRQMSREDKIRACYQHCCLQHVSGEKMTNETLRKRLHIAPENYAIASRIIADALNERLIKLKDTSRSRKYAQYIPIWG
ncbi:MAG: putative DNA binding domain-containing protein [Prevotellaceae bacterium]|jgi:predicted HTH transcriptional regulator|nr:putative DNA binding domain-containing protein [Prevotellaceae bacterium]